VRSDRSGRSVADGSEEIAVVEVRVLGRAPLLAACEQAFGLMPTVASVLRALPDAADYPIFRITSSTRAGASPS
jgi:hypothetical protein